MGVSILALCGFYRTITETFVSFFFAREVESDTTRLGFWVASMYVTVVLAELMGWNLLGSIVLPFLPLHWLFGFDGIFCLLGLASVWRIRSKVE
jgi:hypothetical protein